MTWRRPKQLQQSGLVWTKFSATGSWCRSLPDGRATNSAQAGEDAWKAQCEAVTRQLALPAPTNAQAALTPNTTPLSTGMAPVHSTAPAKLPGLLRRWLRSTG
jgi:hypothetical protein